MIKERLNLKHNVATDVTHFDLVLVHCSDVRLHLNNTSGGQRVLPPFLNQRNTIPHKPKIISNVEKTIWWIQIIFLEMLKWLRQSLKTNTPFKKQKQKTKLDVIKRCVRFSVIFTRHYGVRSWNKMMKETKQTCFKLIFHFHLFFFFIISFSPTRL